MIEEKKSNHKIRNTIIVVIVMLGVIAIYATIDSMLYSAYVDTNRLVYYFFYVLFQDSLSVVLVFFLLFVVVLHGLRKEGININYKKAFGIFFSIVTSIVFVINLFKVSDEYAGVLINNKTPSKFEYKYYILLDVLGKETRTENISVTQINTHDYQYKYRRSTSTYHSYSISFSVGDNREMASVEDSGLIRYIHRLKEIEESIQIEYYPHSGIIKSIDGIEKYEYKNLSQYISDKVEKIESQKRLEEEEILRKEEEANKIARRKNAILNESIGRNIEEVMLQFEEEGLSFTSEIIYLSSQIYDIGAIVFRNNEAVYVVKDNLGEDMIPIPNMEPGMTKEEIISLLTEAAFAYHCEEYSCDTHGKNKLHTYQFSPGTLVPRGYDVGFSVDK